MAYGSKMLIRLDCEIERKLEDCASHLGTSKSALLRLLAKTFVEQVVEPDGSANLPPKWKELLRPADGRTKIKKQNNISAPIQNAHFGKGDQIFFDQKSPAELQLRPAARKPNTKSP